MRSRERSPSPTVTALTGTMFAAVPSYYFRGFGIPVDAGTISDAKTGRAIPRATSGDPTDAVEEYAAGAAGLQNLGDGAYQLNWGTAKSYAGTCRRVRLDLGERNPDGTPYYRTADFRFTR